MPVAIPPSNPAAATASPVARVRSTNRAIPQPRARSQRKRPGARMRAEPRTIAVMAGPCSTGSERADEAGRGGGPGGGGGARGAGAGPGGRGGDELALAGAEGEQVELAFLAPDQPPEQVTAGGTGDEHVP